MNLIENTCLETRASLSKPNIKVHSEKRIKIVRHLIYLLDKQKKRSSWILVLA